MKLADLCLLVVILLCVVPVAFGIGSVTMVYVYEQDKPALHSNVSINWSNVKDNDSDVQIPRFSSGGGGGGYIVVPVQEVNQTVAVDKPLPFINFSIIVDKIPIQQSTIGNILGLLTELVAILFILGLSVGIFKYVRSHGVIRR